jgi:multiple sugar transport system substrate-binding protein
MKKRLIATGVLGIAGIVGLAPQFTATAQGGFKWDQAKGTQIRVLLNQHPWQAAIQPFFGEFEQLTGIKVVAESFPEAQFRNKVLIELASGAGSADAFMLTPNQEGNLYLKSGWLEPLAPYIANRSLTPTDYALNDFFPSTSKAVSIGGALVGLPLQQETTMLFYRKDLFAKYNIAVPRNFAQLEKAAKALNGKDGVNGIGLRGKGASSTSQLAPYMYGFGGEWLTDDRAANFNAKAWQDALTYYTGMLKESGPQGATQMSWPEITALFGQGKLAMFTDGSLFKSVVDDAKSSTVAGKVGYAPFPAGPGGKRTPVVITWGLSMSKASKNKNATWLFMQWATNKQNQLRALLEGVPAARRSVWKDPKFTSSDKNPEWTKVNLEQIGIANPVWNPPVIAVGEVRDALGQAVVGVLNGGNVKELLEKANAATDAILAKEK